MPSLDPTDVFPPRNLPGPAVPWGREVEGVSTLLKGSAKNLRQSIDGLNRSTAASLQTLGDQITTLSSTVSDLEAAIGDLTTFITDESGAGGFSMPTGTTSAVATSNIVVPVGYTKMSILAIGLVEGVNGSGSLNYLYGRIVIEGVNVSELMASPIATSGTLTAAIVSAAHSEAVTPGETITTELRAKGDGGAWGSSATVANISVIALFSK